MRKRICQDDGVGDVARVGSGMVGLWWESKVAYDGNYGFGFDHCDLYLERVQNFVT